MTVGRTGRTGNSLAGKRERCSAIRYRPGDCMPNPRSISVPALAVAASLAAGCGLTDFNISQAVPMQTVPGSNLPTPLGGLFPLPLNLDLSQQIKSRNAGAVDSVTLASLVLTIRQPSDGSITWDFVSTVDVFVEGATSDSSLPRTQIATVSDPTGLNMTFSVDESVNLKPYIEEGSRVSGSGRGEAPARDVSYDGVAVFTVHIF
jgi:hypothetical protein